MTRTQSKLLVRFDHLSSAKANIVARELQQEIRRLTGDEIRPKLEKTKAYTQDLGDVVVIILGTQAVGAFARQIAEGIGAFIARWGTQVLIETRHGRVVLSGHAANDADLEGIVKAMCPPIQPE